MKPQARVVTYPDSVSLVNPPKTTIPKTLAALPRSQYATTFDDVSGKYDFLLRDFSLVFPSSSFRVFVTSSASAGIVFLALAD